VKDLPEEFVFDESDLPPGRGWDIRAIIAGLGRGALPEGFKEFFDRDPERNTPEGPGVVVSPADGILEVVREPGRTRFVVHLRFTDVHVQRVPLSGTVLGVERAGSGFFDPQDPRYPSCVRAVTTVSSRLGTYEVRQMTALLARRIQTFLRPGQAVRAGERLGRILLGSTVELVVPGSLEPAAAPGSRVLGGETVLARF
jgi:phosphatidylserine decarboxylase